MRNIKAALFFIAALIAPGLAQAQSCNDPSGFLKTFGTFNIGDNLVLGPDCQHAQSGSGGGGGTPFGPDAPPNPGTTGVVPAPPSGTTAQSGILGVTGWRAPKPLQRFVMPTGWNVLGFPARPEIVPSYSNGTSGPGSVVMTRTPSDVWMAYLQQQSVTTQTFAYVDPVSGNDANGPTCAQATPCQSLTYCFRNCSAINIVGVATGVFDPFVLDGSVATKFFHRLTFTSQATIANPCPPPSGQTWTNTSLGVWQTTLSFTTTAGQPNRFMYNDTFDPGTGNNVRFPQFASLAALQAASNASPGTVFGWFFDTATKIIYVAFFNLNVNTFKGKMQEFCLAGSGAIGTGDAGIILNGGTALFIDTPYPLNLNGVNIQGYNATTSVPIVLIEGRGLIKQFAAYGNGVHGRGGLWYISGFDCEASSDDCFNFDGSNTGGVHAYVVLHNVRGNYAGDVATFGTGIANNKNGGSCHGGVDCIYAGVQFAYNYGPNLADTVIASDTSLTWAVGVETIQSADGADAGIGFYGNAGDASAIRKAWVDTSATLDEVVSLHGEQSSITVKQTNSMFNVPPNFTNGATLTTYNRNSP